MAVTMDEDLTPSEMRELWMMLDTAPRWCATHRVGTLLRGKLSGKLYESVEAPRLTCGDFYIKARPMHRPDSMVDLRVAEVEPADGLTALGEQAE